MTISPENTAIELRDETIVARAATNNRVQPGNTSSNFEEIAPWSACSLTPHAITAECVPRPIDARGISETHIGNV
jgi:hypothetical protein